MRKDFVAITIFVLLVQGCSSATSSPWSGQGSEPSPAPSSAAPDQTPPAVQEENGYPKGPFGWQVGQVFPNLTFQAKLGGKGAFVEVSTKDYYDRDGSKGITALYLTVSAPWCPACQSEGRSLPRDFSSKYAARGARFFTLLAEDANHEPASKSTVDAWIAAFGTNYDIGIDPTYSALPKDKNGGGSVAIPYNYLIDPRTMRIKSIVSGPIFMPQIPGLDDLIATNGG
jgi:thiol-disulfide isomerase/thioredoxin